MTIKIYYCFLFLQLMPITGLSFNKHQQIDATIHVTNYGIKNNGDVIGSELNDLVNKSYRKTLFFPAGIYNLSEPIVLPYDYSKNVNIIFDKNALIRTDKPLEALIKIGFSEMLTPDKSYRRFSYIEGGMFDCSNVENGIIVNGLKQLVSLKSISLFKGRKTHILITTTDDFIGTGSADTKIDNVTIQGLSSNEDIYGIYIDENCGDIKISNSFIYGTKYGIVTRSGGHILNNIHILSQVTTGGLSKGKENFLETEGICIENSGFFILHEIYFDTIDRSIVITPNHSPTLIIDKNIFYSYLPNFGNSFIFKDHSSNDSFQAKVSNSIFHVKKEGYTILDINPLLVGYDINDNFTFMNCHIINSHLLNTFDPFLLQRIKNKTSSVIISEGIDNNSLDWLVIGSLLASPSCTSLKIDISETHSIELDIKFNNSNVTLLGSRNLQSNQQKQYEVGYVIEDHYCVLFLKTDNLEKYHPIISDLTGNGSYMTPPSNEKIFRILDYKITSEPLLLINSKQLRTQD